jgi:hypothetical protein
MGERHLVYVRLDNKMYGHFLKEEIYYNGCVIGLHHQWLLGYDALNCLVNLLDVHQKNIIAHDGKLFNSSPFQVYAMDALYRIDNDKIYTHAEKVLQALYIACPITGFWSNSARILEKERFFWTDNNTGITVVDLLAFEEPKYCFLNPGSLFANGNLRTLEQGTPLDAETYVHAFGDPPKRWPVSHLSLLLDKVAKIKLLTKEQLYDIFLPKNVLTGETERPPLFLGTL